MKRITTLSFASLLTLFVASCEQKTFLEPVPSTSNSSHASTRSDILSKKELEERMAAIALKNNDEFDWRLADDVMIYSGLKHAKDGNVLMIGYKLPTIKGDYSWDLNQSANKDWLMVREKLLNIAFEEEQKSNPKLKSPSEILVAASKEMPNFDLRVTELSTIQKLWETGLIRYMEPTFVPDDYIGSEKGQAKSGGGFGCGDNTGIHGLQINEDYYSYPQFPLRKVSWQLRDHNMQFAWFLNANGYSQTANKRFTIAYIDTGLSSIQPIMNQNFDDGDSQGRFVASFSTLPNGRGGVVSPEDVCGHGTASASIGTSPSYDNKLIGVAHKANLVSVKASHDVLFSEWSEYRGAADAFSGLARTTADVISMSMGTVLVPYLANVDGTYRMSVNSIRDGVMLAKFNNKVIFCAAGTIPPAVGTVMENLPRYLQHLDIRRQIIFPASMNDAVYAVTGVQRQVDNNNYGLGLRQYSNITTCTSCCYHNDVDFGVVMQKRTGASKVILSLQNANNDIPSNFGGSSSATATMSAMVTAVWSKYPTLNSTEIMNHIRYYSSRYGAVHPKIGYGMLDMFEATRYSQPAR
ncbi:MAG: S8/S53 family peptidase [Bacteroidetes bacterium]|nr:S8/S53 family peptidase [Bacteroidota bacterium]